MAIAASLRGLGYGGEWPRMTLREAKVMLIDCDHRTPPAAAEGYPYVAIPQLRGGRLDLREARRITPEHYEDWTRKARPTAHDVVLSRRCNPGETAWVPPGLEFALGQNLVLLRADGAKVHPPFLRWLARSPDWWEQVEKFINAGAVFDSLRCADVPRFELPVPPLAVQGGIAEILGALDDKIELNRRMSGALEAMARSLFRSWFEERATSEAKAADLVADGVLEIGDGYRAKNSELGAPGLPFVRAGDLDSGFNLAGADVLSEESVAKAGSKVGLPGDVAFTSKGTIGRFARVNRHTPRFVYSPQVCFWRSLDRERLHPAILYCWMVGDSFLSQINAVAGQTDMALYVSLRDQRLMEVPVFAADQSGVGDQIEPFLERQSSLAHESATLAALRDTLLPRLISGELRIPDAERIVGEVA